MLRLSRFASTVIMLMCIYIISGTPIYAQWQAHISQGVEEQRMKNVTAGYENGEELALSPVVIPSPALLPLRVERPVLAVMSQNSETSQEKTFLSTQQARERDEMIKPTTIQGGLSIRNQTAYQVDIGKLLLQPVPLSLPKDQMQILVIHTHASEAYAPAGLDLYEATDDSRTEDTKYNIVRVGDELCSVLEAAGLKVVHDRSIYDYPSYTGSYTRSGDAVQTWLAEYPSIRIIIDVHRDALGEQGTIYKTMAEEEGTVASQVMLLVGTDESGLDHPDWQQNLSLALYLQRHVSAVHPTLMRPVELVPQRYNQHLSPGSLILEVGSSGNTLQEALAAVRLFGTAAAPALAALVGTA